VGGRAILRETRDDPAYAARTQGQVLARLDRLESRRRLTMPPDPRRPEHRRRLELAVFLGFLVVVFVAKLPALDLPYYWDEFGYITAAHWLSGESLVRALPGFRPADAF
jgi:hypothetical protein